MAESPSNIVSFSVPVGLVAVIAASASGSLEPIVDVFLNQLEFVHQFSIVAAFLGVVTICVGLAFQNIPKVKDGISKDSKSETSFVCITRKDMGPGYVPAYPISEIANATSDTDKFKACYPMIKAELLQYLKSENELLPEAVNWIDEMVDYSVPGGKLNRGTTVLNVYATIQKQFGRSTSNLDAARACVAGWSVEFLQAFFLVADDIMDDSKTRRGLPCWFRLPHTGLIAINDAFLLESFVYQILRTHFGSEPCYADLLELMIDATQKTEIGQLLDLTSQPVDKDKFDLSRFTIQRYKQIVKYKTAFYSFYLPTAMGMILAGIRDTNAYHTAKYVCCLMGEYFQIQDDYLDCFGLPEVIGKVGTDIQENKCSWLIVQALERCNDEQRKLLHDNYGKWDDDAVAKVKSVYNELNISMVFKDYEETSYAHIQKELDKAIITTPDLPRDVFELLLKKIYKRSK